MDSMVRATYKAKNIVLPRLLFFSCFSYLQKRTRARYDRDRRDLLATRSRRNQIEAGNREPLFPLPRCTSLLLWESIGSTLSLRKALCILSRSRSSATHLSHYDPGSSERQTAIQQILRRFNPAAPFRGGSFGSGLTASPLHVTRSN